ncbi:MAG TPA: OmpA family protein [Rhizomicrobium sp.]|jgi:outer membrane protein OmpA-like peptidoglycan-associated protein|nr:OmpA family protein [Rhizomicrobium sp.]
MSKSILIAVAIAMLAGCMTEPPPERAYPPEFAAPPPPRAAKAPAETVAPAPGLHQAEIKPLGRGLLAAQAAGGYMDGQEKELRAGLRGTGVTVSRMGDSLVLNLRADTVFGGKTAEISEQGRRIVDKISDSIRKFDSTQIVINGFTDTTGTEARNLKVSQERADAVARAFAEDGVDSHRVAAKGFGDEILKIPTGPDVSEPRNRRLEIRITPRVKT